MTIRLEDDLKAKLEKLSEITSRSKSFLAAEAVRDFIESNEWQLAEIRKALAEADKGEFASDKAVQETFRKWGVNGN